MAKLKYYCSFHCKRCGWGISWKSDEPKIGGMKPNYCRQCCEREFTEEIREMTPEEIEFENEQADKAHD